MRDNWSTYFLKLAHAAAERSTCPRRHVGAVLVRDKRVIGTGYNGSLPGDVHCDDVGCDMRGGSCVRTIHAEANVIGSTSALARAGSTLFVTDYPCRDCAALIATSGVIELVYDRPYVDKAFRAEITPAQDLFNYHGIVATRYALV